MKVSNEKHHHSFRNLFKKEQTPPAGGDSDLSASSSHTGLSKIFHHHHQTPEKPENLSRTPSLMSLKRNNTNPPQLKRNPSDANRHPQPQIAAKEPKKLSKAQTIAHLQSLNHKNAARSQLKSTHGGGSDSNPPSASGTNHGDKIVYNPYGLNKNAPLEMPKNTSFYLSGVIDGQRVLANPVADPNDFLPEDMKQDHVNLFEDFELDVSTKKLGDGGSSDVRIINAINKKREFYALKKFTLLSKETDDEFYVRVAKEYVISRKISKSRHVCDTLGLVRIQSHQNLTRGWGMVLEFCSGGDLFGNIIKPGWKRQPLNEKFCIFKQICFGVKYLHDMDIVHRDLKPENVLIDANGVAKLCDFGVSEYGHEVPHDLTSPIKLHHTYLGSPPYSPPEVMLLKEKSAQEAKSFQYDPFKMDCWGLGMLLFCIVYGSLPFQQASVADHAFRDYKFNHGRYCSDHPHFKSGDDFSKGPGLEFKWAAQFHSTGASRVAWKLCDPSENNRYTLETLFKDPWFVGLEMCIYEHPDQEVNPFVLPGTGDKLNTHSNHSSVPSSQAPSRRGTVSHQEDAEGLIHAPVRSMLDLAAAAGHLKAEKEDAHDNESINSASSLTHSPLQLQKDSFATTSTLSLESGEHKIRSMLDEPKIKENNLPAVAEAPAVEESALEQELKRDQAQEQQHKHEQKQAESPQQLPMEDLSRALPDCGKAMLRSSSDLKLDTSGMCELGYKIKKHHHNEVSNVAYQGSIRRR